jgi:hypothetical protein
MSHRWYTRLVIAGLVLATTMGHGDGCCSSSIFGPPSGATCPPSSTLTYDNFGKQFMETYCTSCHSSELSGAKRNGAPLFHDFDTLVGIRAVANHIDETTAAGPDATNDGMPPNAPFPTLLERQQLGEWIACGMP